MDTRIKNRGSGCSCTCHFGYVKKFTPDLKRKAIALFALVGTLLWQTAFTQVGVILIAAFFGFLLYKQHNENDRSKFTISNC